MIIVRLAESENNQSASSELLKEKENNAKQTEFETDLVEGWKKRKLEPKGKSQSKNAKKTLKTSTEITQMFLTKSFNTPQVRKTRLKTTGLTWLTTFSPLK